MPSSSHIAVISVLVHGLCPCILPLMVSRPMPMYSATSSETEAVEEAAPEMEVFYTFRWAPKPRAPRPQQGGNRRQGGGAPRAEGAAPRPEGAEGGRPRQGKKPDFKGGKPGAATTVTPGADDEMAALVQSMIATLKK